MKLLVLISIAVAVLLAAVFVFRPDLAQGARGRILAFLALFLLPFLAFAFGADIHLETSKSTEFCLSCHVMEPYGQSLRIADQEYLPAVHFQNSLVPRDRACYSCHTQYTMYGDLHAKLVGLEHLWVNYFGTPAEPMALYQPYRNRECLHCHGGARSFEEEEFHEELREELRTDETSCLECHDLVHGITDLDGLETWSSEDPS